MRDRPIPSYRQLCVMAHYALDTIGDNAGPSDVMDELKWMIARARLSYPPPHWLSAVAEAVLCARAKGYRTPRTRQ